MSEFLSILGLIGLALTIFGAAAMVVLTVGLRLERRAIRDLKPTEPVTDRSKYEFLIKTNEQAESLGMTGPEWYEDTTGLLGRAKYAIWMSDDSRTLLLIAQSSSGIAYEKKIILSRLDDVRVLKTADGYGEHDLLGYIQSQTKFGAELLDLLALHLAALDVKGNVPIRMTARPALLEYEAIERDRVQRMVDRKLAVWLTGDNEPWRHTTLGAFLGYLVFIRTNFWKMVREGAHEGWKDGDEVKHVKGEVGSIEPGAAQEVKAES